MDKPERVSADATGNDELGRGEIATPRLGFSDALVVNSQSAGRSLLRAHPEYFVAVIRDIPRTALFVCPCGCGAEVSINLDPAIGKAWRLQLEPQGATLMPSVWLLTGCQSHFIVWHSHIWWCRYRGDYDNGHSHGVNEIDDGDVDWPEGMIQELREEWRRIVRTDQYERPELEQ